MSTETILALEIAVLERELETLMSSVNTMGLAVVVADLIETKRALQAQMESER
jgi:hypothetical protein